MDKYNFLSEQEKNEIESFYKNEVMREAVKKILLMGIYENGVMKAGVSHNPQMNWALGLAWETNGTSVTNEKIGSDLRAIAEGIKSVEIAFKELEKFKKAVKSPIKGNPAR